MSYYDYETGNGGDNPAVMRTIFTTLAENGIYGTDAENVLRATSDAFFTPAMTDAAEEALTELGITERPTNFEDTARALLDGRGRVKPAEYASALVRLFRNADGLKFALLADTIEDRLAKAPAKHTKGD